MSREHKQYVLPCISPRCAPEGTHWSTGKYLLAYTEGTYSRGGELRRSVGVDDRPRTADQLGERLLGGAGLALLLLRPVLLGSTGGRE